MNIKDSLKKGFLRRISPSEDLAIKEFRESRYDLEKAKKALSEKDYKWAIIKAYYASFHAAKGILYKKGYKEKKHVAIISVLEELVKQGVLQGKFVVYFKAAMSAREDADYNYIYSKETAEWEVEQAESFVEKMNLLFEK